MRALPFLLTTLVLLAPHAAADHVPKPARTAEELAVFHTWVTLTRDLQRMAAEHPDLMTLQSIGKSVLGLDLWAVRLRAESDVPFEARERLYIDGGIHANEHLGMELALLYVTFLVEGHGKDENATWILENRDTLVVPMVNPDGNLVDRRQNARLVDMNRNFPYGWGGPGASDTLGSSTYRGPSPGSEPEVQAVMRAIQAFDPDYSQSYHTGTTMLLHPWGGNDTALPDGPVYDRICQEFRRIEGSDRFPCGPVYSTIYPATGGTVDFAYGVTGAISFTYEVDDLQTTPFSLEDLRERLRVPFEAQMQAFRDVHRYGSLPVLEDVFVEPSGDTQLLRVTVRNDGWLATNRTDLRIRALDEGVLLHEARLGRIEPGATATVEVVLPSTAQRLRFEADHDKNALMPRAKV
ncbi:MAG TPA: M14 family zinc carboxypeptidase, partial [Candidatus Thermoplasmatota archaeon]|nr:M14 family zinc carboxypeptidase [Candidatus Thermoplasmatota archaeon]